MKYAKSARSPVFTHLSSSLAGLITIRAHQSQDLCQRVFDEAQDINTSARFLLMSTSRWFGVWLDLIASTLVMCVTFTCILLPAEGTPIYNS